MTDSKDAVTIKENLSCWRVDAYHISECILREAGEFSPPQNIRDDFIFLCGYNF